MNVRLLRFFALFVIVALAIPALAKPVTKSLSLSGKTRIGGTQLDAGEYKLVIDGTTVTIKQGNRVLGQVEGEWEQRDTRHERSSVLQGANGAVKEIRFRGETRVLLIRAR
jgi:hypothetical protein